MCTGCMFSSALCQWHACFRALVTGCDGFFVLGTLTLKSARNNTQKKHDMPVKLKNASTAGEVSLFPCFLMPALHDVWLLAPQIVCSFVQFSRSSLRVLKQERDCQHSTVSRAWYRGRFFCACHWMCSLIPFPALDVNFQFLLEILTESLGFFRLL